MGARRNDRAGRPWGEPFKPYRTIFEQESQQAATELARPLQGLLISGLLAGFGIGTSALAVAAVLQAVSGTAFEPLGSLLAANAYALGFVLVILARTDLFTEYTTIAILPVLTGNAGLGALARLWGAVYVANLVGGAVFALLLALLGPALGFASAEVLGALGADLVAPGPGVMVASASLAGLLMGLMSWLVVAGRETISQALLIWLVAAAIGLGHLHHAITGSIEVLTAVLLGHVSLGDFGRFLAWTTLGNALGGLIFALGIRYSVLLSEESGEGAR